MNERYNSISAYAAHLHTSYIIIKKGFFVIVINEVSRDYGLFNNRIMKCENR